MRNAATQNAYFQLHLAVLLFGGAGLFAKLIPIAPSLLVWGRAMWAVLFLLLLMRLTQEKIGRIQWREWRSIVVLGGVLAFHWVAFFQSIQYATVAVGVLTFASFPVFTVLLAPIFLKDEIKWQELGLACLTLLGVAIIVPLGELSSNYTLGVIWGLASGASFALLSLLNKLWIAQYSVNKTALFQNFGATLCLLPFALTIDWNITVLQFGYWALLGIVFTGLSHTLFIASLQHIKAQTASIVAALEPVYGILWALVLLGELPSGRELFGGAVMLLAAAAVNIEH